MLVTALFAAAGGACAASPSSPAPSSAPPSRAPSSSSRSAGVVHFAKAAESGFDRFTKAPTRARQRWMRAHYWRMRAYAPYFDARLRWFPRAWVYSDASAIYRGSRLAAQHPSWILRDASGAPLFIPFGCRGGACPQYAADIGSPAFRAWWIATARARLAAGYRGIFIDDVNMVPRVAYGDGTAATPVDPRTHLPMTPADWARSMADFMQRVRAALPRAELVHNALWFAGDDTPDLQRELRAANLIELERGVNDAGLTGGTGRFSLDALLKFVDRRHAEGHGVILDGHAETPAERLYGLAAYFLVSSGRDALGNTSASTPADWWRGYDTRLGAPLGSRYVVGGVLRRDFTRGVVLLSEPGAPARTVTVGPGLRDLQGTPRTSVTLGPASGAVLVRGAAARPHPARIRLTARIAGGGRGVRLEGSVEGARVRRVTILVQGRRSRAWVLVHRRAARLSPTGRFARTEPRLPRGTYRAQARVAAVAPFAAGRSAFRAFRTTR